MKGLFIRSINRKEKIIIIYIDSNHQITQRYIRVLGIHHNKIIAFCYYRKQVRTFKLDSILSAGPLKKSVSA